MAAVYIEKKSGKWHVFSTDKWVYTFLRRRRLGQWDEEGCFWLESYEVEDACNLLKVQSGLSALELTEGSVTRDLISNKKYVQLELKL